MPETEKTVPTRYIHNPATKMYHDSWGLDERCNTDDIENVVRKAGPMAGYSPCAWCAIDEVEAQQRKRDACAHLWQFQVQFFEPVPDAMGTTAKCVYCGEPRSFWTRIQGVDADGATWPTASGSPGVDAVIVSPLINGPLIRYNPVKEAGRDGNDDGNDDEGNGPPGGAPAAAAVGGASDVQSGDSASVEGRKAGGSRRRDADDRRGANANPATDASGDAGGDAGGSNAGDGGGNANPVA